MLDRINEIKSILWARAQTYANGLTILPYGGGDGKLKEFKEFRDEQEKMVQSRRIVASERSYHLITYFKILTSPWEMREEYALAREAKRLVMTEMNVSEAHFNSA